MKGAQHSIVGCNLCVNVCPVENCISREPISGVDPRTKRPVLPDYANWTTHPNNPNAVREAAEEAQSRKLANCLIHDRISRRITVNNSHPSLAAGIFKCRELACQE
jgi:ferredoxin